MAKITELDMSRLEELKAKAKSGKITDEERREKKSRRKEKMENFKKLLEESGLTSKATFSDFATKVRL